MHQVASLSHFKMMSKATSVTYLQVYISYKSITKTLLESLKIKHHEKISNEYRTFLVCFERTRSGSTSF